MFSEIFRAPGSRLLIHFLNGYKTVPQHASADYLHIHVRPSNGKWTWTIWDINDKSQRESKESFESREEAKEAAKESRAVEGIDASGLKWNEIGPDVPECATVGQHDIA